MQQQKKTVIITGMYGPYLGELDNELGDNAEVWSCNMGYTIQRGISRVYVFDKPERWLPTPEKLQAFIDDLNDLDVPVYLMEENLSIPRSVRFPANEIIDAFGFAYATSTLTWQIAHAIYEGFEQIVIHKIHCMPAAVEYFPQKACMDFWLGMALGKGIEVVISDDSHLCRPHPWHSPLYGYEAKTDGDVMDVALASVVKELVKTEPAWDFVVDSSQALYEKNEGLKSSGLLRYYAPIKKPIAECQIPTRLTEVSKRLELAHSAKIRLASEAVNAQKETAHAND